MVRRYKRFHTVPEGLPPIGQSPLAGGFPQRGSGRADRQVGGQGGEFPGRVPDPSPLTGREQGPHAGSSRQSSGSPAASAST